MQQNEQMAFVRRFAELRKKKDTLEQELKQVGNELAQLEPLVLDFFQTQGVSNVRINGQTVYLRRELWVGRSAETISFETVCEQLHIAGLGQYAQFRPNFQGLSALARELDSQGMSLTTEYPTLEGYVKLAETFRVSGRKSV